MTESAPPNIHPEIAALFNRPPRRRLTRLVPTMQSYVDYTRLYERIYNNVRTSPQFAGRPMAVAAEKAAQIVDEGLAKA